MLRDNQPSVVFKQRRSSLPSLALLKGLFWHPRNIQHLNWLLHYWCFSLSTKKESQTSWYIKSELILFSCNVTWYLHWMYYVTTKAIKLHREKNARGVPASVMQTSHCLNASAPIIQMQCVFLFHNLRCRAKSLLAIKAIQLLTRNCKEASYKLQIYLHLEGGHP